MVVSRQQHPGQNQYLPIANKSFVNVTDLKHFGKLVTNKNCIHEEIKKRLNSGNACCNSFGLERSVFSSHL
jgi:hypothetical protein